MNAYTIRFQHRGENYIALKRKADTEELAIKSIVDQCFAADKARKDFCPPQNIRVEAFFPHIPVVDKLPCFKKCVIKLDKNFHVYIHGDRNLIENGADDRGKFVKIYYNEAT